MIKVTPLVAVGLLGLLLILVVVAVGFGPEESAQLKGQVAAGSTSACWEFPTCRFEWGCSQPALAVACDSPACNWGECTVASQVIQCQHVVDPCAGNPMCLAPINIRPVACSDPDCNQGPCQVSQPIPTSVATVLPVPSQLICPVGSEMLCPGCAAGTPSHLCQCTCYAATAATPIPLPVPTAAPGTFSWLNPANWFSSPQTATVPQYPSGDQRDANPAPTTVPSNQLPTDIYTGPGVSPAPAYNLDGVPVYTGQLPVVSVQPVTPDAADEAGPLGRLWGRVTQTVGNLWSAVRNWQGVGNQAD